MSSSPDPDLKRWVDNWRILGPELERIKRQELRRLDSVEAVGILGDAFDQAVASAPSQPTSGLVEQQYWFQKLRP